MVDLPVRGHTDGMPAVFVGSTYDDLKEYRKAVASHLRELGFRVLGMEDFGARPRTPLPECLREVRSSHIYLGIFGMKYGSRPASLPDRSFSHHEYLEAKRLTLPSLIFEMDEWKARIPPIFVDTDPDDTKALKDLKASLRRDHTVEKFSTEQDLGSKAAESARGLLKQFRSIEHLKSIRNSSVLRCFYNNPEEYACLDVMVDCKNQEFHVVDGALCRELGFDVGALQRSFVRTQQGQMTWLYVSPGLSRQLEKLARDAIVRILCTTQWVEVRDDEHRFLLGRELVLGDGVSL